MLGEEKLSDFTVDVIAQLLWVRFENRAEQRQLTACPGGRSAGPVPGFPRDGGMPYTTQVSVSMTPWQDSATARVSIHAEFAARRSVDPAQVKANIASECALSLTEFAALLAEFGAAISAGKTGVDAWDAVCRNSAAARRGDRRFAAPLGRACHDRGDVCHAPGPHHRAPQGRRDRSARGERTVQGAPGG